MVIQFNSFKNILKRHWTGKAVNLWVAQRLKRPQTDRIHAQVQTFKMPHEKSLEKPEIVKIHIFFLGDFTTLGFLAQSIFHINFWVQE